MEKILRRWPVLVLAAGVLAFIADLQGAMDFWEKHILPSLRSDIPAGIVIPTVIAFAFAAFYLGRRAAAREGRKADPSSILTEGQFFERLHLFLTGASREILVAGLSKDWIFPLAISVFLARQKGVRIDVACTDGTHERYRLLENLGCRVFRFDGPELPISGALADPDEILHSRAALECPRRQRENIFGRYYYGSLDWPVISAAASRMRAEAIKQNVQPSGDEEFVPDLVEAQDGEVLARLAEVRAYQGAKFEIEEVEIDELHPISTQVLTYKLKQVDQILHLYETKGWNFFRSCGLSLKNGKVSLLVPPVIEVHSGKLCVAEGHTRLYRLRQRKVNKAKVVVVRSVALQLPAKPSDWSHIKIQDDKTERRDAQFARYIETTTHRNIWS
jgi:hypothetical protein